MIVKSKTLAGLRRALRAGLGLPRHADRGADREEARQEPAGRRDAAPVPRLRRRADRAPEGATSCASACWATGTIRTSPWLHGNEADEIRALGMLLEEGLRLPRPEAGELVLRLRLGAGRGRGRVRGPQGSPAIDVGFRVRRSATSSRSAFGLRTLADKPGFAVIWTTTPWTLPATRRSTCIRSSTTTWSTPTRGLLILAADLQRGVPRSATGSTGNDARRRCKGAALEGLAFRHPFYDRAVAGVPRRLRHARHRHRHRAHARRPTASKTSSRAAATA